MSADVYAKELARQLRPITRTPVRIHNTRLGRIPGVAYAGYVFYLKRIRGEARLFCTPQKKFSY